MPTDWDRAVADPVLLAAARRRYTGRGDLLDQLWWSAHPGTATPEGLPDPRRATEAARRGLYRPGADPGAAAGLLEQEAAIEADRAAATTAFREAAAGAVAAPVPASAEGAPVLGRRFRVVAGALLVAAFLAGAALGRVPPPAAPDATKGADAYDVFNRPQRSADRIDGEVLPSFIPSPSTRLLRSFSSIGTSVYAGRTLDARVCLVAVVLSDRTASSCTTEPGFAEAGLSIGVQADADPVDDSGRAPRDEFELLWERSGALSILPEPRPGT